MRLGLIVVAVVGREDFRHHFPQPRALFARRSAGRCGEAVGHDLQFDRWVGGKILIPERALGRAADRGDDDMIVAVRTVDQCRLILLAGTAACRRQ